MSSEDSHHDDHPYHPQDAITPALKATGIVGGAGIFAASIQATLQKQNIGLLGTFTRYGGTIAVFGAMGGTYEFFRRASANLRAKNDTYNEAIGGFVAGSMLGLRLRSIPATIGYGAGLAITMSAFQYTGSSFFGYRKDPTIDEYDRKQGLRHNRRRPIEETIEELGEGRGIYAPGYAERRAQRIKERYGIDVPLSSPIDGSTA